MVWHSQHDGREWRLAPEGVYSREPTSASPNGDLHRTRGEPRTVHRYLHEWGHHIILAGRETGVPVSILLMTIATENGSASYARVGQLKVPQFRKEPGYVSDDETPNRISFGPCHILLSSARTALGAPGIDGQWLSRTENNIAAAAAFIANQHDITGYDPILTAAGYNSGGIHRAIPGTSRYGNRWHLRSYGNHLDRAAAWFGDACRVLVAGL